MPSKVELQVELVARNAEAKLKELDKLAKEMGNRKITLNFDEASLSRWQAATASMTNAQLNAYAKMAVAAEQTKQVEINAATATQKAVIDAEAKKVLAVERTTQTVASAEAKKVAAEEAGSAKRTAAAEKTATAQINATAKAVAAAESGSAKRATAEARVQAAEQKTAQTEMALNAKLVIERQKSLDKKIELWEKEDTKRRQIAAKTEQEEIKANGKIQVATLKGVKGTRQQTQAQKELNDEAQKTPGIFDSITQRFTAANLISSAITRGITLLRTALRQAIDEMKEMDKELTTIKMVTGASDTDISALRQQAFAGARETGRTTSDYLSAAERFARAGYRENIQDLTRLSLVTQNVGGVTEDVASKFLLAADAAWKMGGSAEHLWTMLDGVTAIADQNATDVGKIAEAYTVAGSAFANAGESERTFAALIGTTTAATQRSGSEMARGLQTILFRVRQVKGELDDGEMIEAEDISNAAKALDSVGISVLNDSKELKNFSDIMGELNEKWDTLNTKQKAYLQNALAGNRRGNVLFSLMDNWNVFEKQLQQYDEASGTALEKNAIFTESWAASTNNLKTAWTELIDTMTESGSILQGVIDLTTSLIDKISTFTHEFQREDGILWFFKHLDNYSWEAAPDGNFRLRRKDILEEDNKALEKAEEVQNDLSDATIQVIKSYEEETEAVNELSEAFSRANANIKDATEKMKDEKDSSIKSAADIYKAMQEAAEKGYYGSEAYKAGANLFFGTTDHTAITKEAQAALDTYFKAMAEGDYSNAAAGIWGAFANASGQIVDKTTGDVIASMTDLGDSFQWAFNKGGQSMDEFLDSMQTSTGIGKDFWASMIKSLGMYSDEMDKWMEENTKMPEPELKIQTDSAEEEVQSAVDRINKMLDSIHDKTLRINVIESMNGVSVPMAEYYASNATKSYAWSGYGSSATRKAGGKHDRYSGIALVNDEFPADGSTPELIISKSQGRAYIANGGRPALVNLGADDIVLTSRETKSAFGVPGFPVGKNIQDAFRSGSVITTSSPKSSKSSSGGSGGSGASADATESWNQLKKLIDYMIDEQKDILDDNLELLDKQLKELEASRKSQQKEDDLAEKQLKVDEALLDLQKAQVERTVRYYNESTQQWEWMADQGALAKAEEAYTDALKNLNDFLSDLDFEAQKAAIQSQKDALQEAFDTYKDGWDTIIKEIEKPTGDLAALFEDLKNNGAEFMKEQASGIASLLNALETGFFDGITDVTDLASSGIEKVVERANAFLESLNKSEEAVAEAVIGSGTSGSSSGSSGGGSGGGSGGKSFEPIKNAVTNAVNTAATTAAAVASNAVAETVVKASAATSNNLIEKIAGKSKLIPNLVDQTVFEQPSGAPSSPNVLSSINGGNISGMLLAETATGVARSIIEGIAGRAKPIVGTSETGILSPIEKIASKSIINSGGNTYINGVQIGKDQMETPLNKVLSNLRIHTTA